MSASVKFISMRKNDASKEPPQLPSHRVLDHFRTGSPTLSTSMPIHKPPRITRTSLQSFSGVGFTSRSSVYGDCPEVWELHNRLLVCLFRFQQFRNFDGEH